MKNQALFSSEDKSEKLKCRLLPFLFGALRVNITKTAMLLNDADGVANSIAPSRSSRTWI